jgi:C4-dicarboxylate transporter
MIEEARRIQNGPEVQIVGLCIRDLELIKAYSMGSMPAAFLAFAIMYPRLAVHLVGLDLSHLPLKDLLLFPVILIVLPLLL